MFRNPDPAAIRALLREVKTIAVVGLSPDPARPSFRVAQALQRLGYRIIPVRPKTDSVLGEKAYASLAEIPQPVDLVDVFRASPYVAAIVEECLRLGVPRLWLQDGVIDPVAAQKAQAAGITVVMDRCLWRDHDALLGTDSPADHSQHGGGKE